MNALAPHTTAIFSKATQLECIKPFLLVGGTALSLQLGTRLSEDLDFMRWRTHKAEKMVKSKNILAMLTNGKRFCRDANFEQMQPKYEVSAEDIEQYFKSTLN